MLPTRIFLSLYSVLCLLPETSSWHLGTGRTRTSGVCLMKQSNPEILALHASNRNKEDASPSRLSRRSFLRFTSVFGLVVASQTPQFAVAADDSTRPVDELDAFGQELQQQSGRWPDSPSPLPSMKRSAQELTMEANATAAAAAAASSDMQSAIERASKKKQIHPRTHG